jgi:hypothetical protein
MPPLVSPSSEADIADDTDHPPTGDKHPEAVTPHLVQFILEPVVLLDVAELSGVVVVLLQCPVGRGGHDEVNRLIQYPPEFSSVTLM